MTEISVFQLKRRRDAGEPHLLLDVREPEEIAVAAAVNLAGGIDAWSEAIDPSVPRY